MTRTNGKVYLVGAGPGDPELLTLKALRAIEAADVIVYDRLVSSAVIDMAPAGAARIFVGKQPGHHPVPQEEINGLISRLARSGRVVVRLKGGDPLIFGRGGEEALELAAAGIDFEIIPGVTAAQGAAAALGAPLTHRHKARSVRYVTGHCCESANLELDWAGLADADTTLVVYMGRANAQQICSRLIRHGLPGSTPALLVTAATTPQQTDVLTRLDAVAATIEDELPEGPTLIIIGSVAALACRRAPSRHVKEHTREPLSV